MNLSNFIYVGSAEDDKTKFSPISDVEQVSQEFEDITRLSLWIYRDICIPTRLILEDQGLPCTQLIAL